MSKILLEFATPIYITDYEEADRFKNLLMNMVIEETELAKQKSHIARGQEFSNSDFYLQPYSSGIKPDLISIGRSVKSETFDDLHLKNEMTRPFFIWCLNEFKHFIENLSGIQIQDYIVPLIQNCWASVYKAGDYHQHHNHPMSAFSGIYCVEAPDADLPQGVIDFIDPRSNINYYIPHVPLFINDTRSVVLRPGQWS
jgi:hypothetical protein